MPIHRATSDHAALLAEHRACVWHEVGDWSRADLEPQIPVWTAFFRRCLADESYVAFVAEDEGNVIGSGAVLVHLGIPRPGSRSEYAGRVQSVYVVPSARRRGVARSIMLALVAYARARPLMSLSLHPSAQAVPLYTALGFVVADEMQLRLGNR